MNRATITPIRTVSVAIFCFCMGFISRAQSQHLEPSQVLVVYNNAVPDSVKLARIYQVARKIPSEQILGFDLSTQQDISREEFETSLLTPLRDHFDKQRWWKRSRDPQGVLLPTENRIRAIVLMRGVPLRIKPTAATSEDAKPANPFDSRDEASVDSELALFGIETLPSKGILKNSFFESDTPLSQAKSPFLVLVNRIDAPAFIICKRMINDAIETEKHGLWGRAYIDVANKFPQGDEWMEKIASDNLKLGIPTVIDRFNDTLPKNYPMTEAALYYGWYDRNVSGPFLNPTFLFRPGAVALHLHSFSAEQLNDAHKNWAAPLLVRGAAATVGNVYEPYLQLSHHFDILHNRLLRGWTFAEAAWAAMPVNSWQGVVLGDPLYRPFIHLDGTGERRDKDRDFRALRAAKRQWPEDSAERRKKLSAASEQLPSGNLAEGLALEYLAEKDIPNAQTWLNNARERFTTKEDQLRQDIQLIAIERSLNQNQNAIAQLKAAKETYRDLPEADALSGWLDILDPPPPPIADPSKLPQ